MLVGDSVRICLVAPAQELSEYSREIAISEWTEVGLVRGFVDQKN
jgi:hypothetical protein